MPTERVQYGRFKRGYSSECYACGLPMTEGDLYVQIAGLPPSNYHGHFCIDCGTGDVGHRIIARLLHNAQRLLTETVNQAQKNLESWERAFELIEKPCIHKCSHCGEPFLFAELRDYAHDQVCDLCFDQLLAAEQEAQAHDA